MDQRTEEWMQITQPDGKKMIASPSYIRKLLGLDKTKADVWNLRNRVYILERKVHKLETPQRQREVIDLLGPEEKPRNFRWLEFRVPNLDLTDMVDLVDQGVTSTEKAGKNTMYSIVTHESRSTEVEE